MRTGQNFLKLMVALFTLWMMTQWSGPVDASGQARTETNCNFGMVKGQAKGSCQVPIPSGCTVAKFPGFDQNWADVSKGGNTSCRFDQKKSDWKTKIIGTCEQCKTEKCTARFSVMFNCTSTTTPPEMQRQTR